MFPASLRIAIARMVLAGLSLLLLPAIGAAQGSADAQRVALGFGVNAVDLNADGVEDRVIVSWRETFNGAGHRILHAMIAAEPRVLFTEERAAARSERVPDPVPVWDAVMLRNPQTGRDGPLIVEEESGNCALRRVALFTAAEGAVLVIAEKRDFASLFEVKPIAIDFYALVENEAGNPGTSRFAFERQRSIETETGYCDAGLALDDVLAGLE